MRELLTSEVKLVSGAGVVTDSEKGKLVKDALTILSKIPATKPGAEFANWYMKINDEIWTYTYNQVIKGIDEMFEGVGGIPSMFQ